MMETDIGVTVPGDRLISGFRASVKCGKCWGEGYVQKNSVDCCQRSSPVKNVKVKHKKKTRRIPDKRETIIGIFVGDEMCLSLD